ncbi:putative WD-repeat protein [Amylocarpus encephaloides]|uniref:WD-repeat protein n=1 Tax=Amylocarpus encephaloides TaxID=45428 RepID=A0A9P8C435_9HELO|nr:putative WD-repeat protein [Amylocarpus encephaloides]
MSLIYGEGEQSAFRRLRKELGLDNDLLDFLPHAIEAPFNSVNHQDEPICLPNTRVDLLQEIYDWDDGEDGRCIFWLNGLAGTGKSTIARTIAQRYNKEERLGASFFFSRGGGDVRHASKFFTSIAVQLANNAISNRKNITSQSFRDQWSQLILCPLSKLSSGSSPSAYVLVIDALDECDRDEHIRMILLLLAEARTLKTTRLRVLLTSRPEILIRHGFYQVPDAQRQDFILHNEWNLGVEWPGEVILRQLVSYSCGLFIWVATACRFIREGKRFAPKRLYTILEGSSSAITAPEKHLDEIYLSVLNHSISLEYSDEEKEEVYEMFRYTLGSIVVLLSPLSTSSLSRLLHLLREDVDRIFEDLHAILDIPNDPTRQLHLHHPSFRDFLLNKDRCRDFWLMSRTLKKDICQVRAPSRQVSQVESSYIQKHLPPEVQYACLYWVQHLQQSGSQAFDGKVVAYQFLQEHLLHWLEALGWMGKVSQWIQAILTLEAHMPVNESPNLYTFIYDAKRFILYNRLAIEHTPLQLYCSALIFTPGNSIIRKTFENYIPNWIQLKRKVQAHWNAALQTLEGHSSLVSSVAFSPDGKQVVSGSDDRTVQLWDTATGAALQTFEGHSNWVTSVAFSPDGKQVVSGSRDKTVRVWDAVTGVVLQRFKGHRDWVTSVAFSPDGKQVVSGSGDKTVRLWDAARGVALQTPEGHSGSVTSVAFSPDGKQVVSGSSDKTVRLWDAATGAALQTLEGHSGSVNSVAFSPDGKQVVSGSNDRIVRLWDAATGVVLQTLEGHSGSVTSVASSPDGKLLPILRVSNHWIVEEGINILWLPPGYREASSVTWNRSLTIGHPSGGISFFYFKKGVKEV